MTKKKHKVIVVGLPKTGTSTLAVMLRMLNYNVSGPDGNYKIGDNNYLEQKFNTHDAFQDFPWCFEWQRFFDNSKVKFIILKRDKQSWWQSFYKSYGWQQENYMSYPFIKIKKHIDNKDRFIAFFDAYYHKLDIYAQKMPNRFLTVSINTFQWKDLCFFLNEPVPKNIFGKPVKKPHVNKNNNVSKHSKINKLKVYLRQNFIPIIGRKYWNAIIAFLRKNKMYS